MSSIRRYPHIGARWTPAHVVRQDSASGYYEELNAPSSRLSADAMALQSALLRRPQRMAAWWRPVSWALFVSTWAAIGLLLAWRG